MREIVIKNGRERNREIYIERENQENREVYFSILVFPPKN